MRPTKLPVVVVGAGPTGLVLANLLGMRGIATMLIERNPAPLGEPRAVTIDDESLRTLQAAGLVEEILPTLLPGYGSHYFTAAGRCFAKVEPSGRPYGYPRRNGFRQPQLEAQLTAALQRFPHVAQRFGWRVVGFAQDETGVEVEIADAAGFTERVACDYLVGCDGAHSTVRHGLGISLRGTSFEERWLVVDLERATSSERQTSVFCDPRRPCIALPGPGATRRFEFKLRPGESDEEMLAPPRLAQLLAAQGAPAGAELRRAAIYRFHARMAPRWSEGRVFLAGDAAHLTPPFAGQGMNSGIRDAHNLAWKLACVVERRLGPTLLASYEQERRPHAWKLIKLALRMGRVMSPRSPVAAWTTQTLLAALGRAGWTRRFIAEMQFKPEPRFTRGFLARRFGRRGPVGSLLPQPLVRDSAGRPVRLDTALGEDFALLAYSDDPARVFAAAERMLPHGLKLRRVAILPSGLADTAIDGVTVVRDLDGGVEAALGKLRDHLLVLRPDHYVLACCPVEACHATRRKLAQLTAETWQARARPLRGAPPVPSARPVQT